jgi:hypothetical protein
LWLKNVVGVSSGAPPGTYGSLDLAEPRVRNVGLQWRGRMLLVRGEMNGHVQDI